MKSRKEYIHQYILDLSKYLNEACEKYPEPDNFMQGYLYGLRQLLEALKCLESGNRKKYDELYNYINGISEAMNYYDHHIRFNTIEL